jgi:hypothetical protein
VFNAVTMTMFGGSQLKDQVLTTGADFTAPRRPDGYQPHPVSQVLAARVVVVCRAGRALPRRCRWFAAPVVVRCLAGRALPRELLLEDPVRGLWEQPTRQSRTGAARPSTRVANHHHPRGTGPYGEVVWVSGYQSYLEKRANDLLALIDLCGSL